MRKIKPPGAPEEEFSTPGGIDPENKQMDLLEEREVIGTSFKISLLQKSEARLKERLKDLER